MSRRMNSASGLVMVSKFIAMGIIDSNLLDGDITLAPVVTWDRDVSSIDTGSTLHTQTIAKGIGIASITSIA